jgi:hypothetical protein
MRSRKTSRAQPLTALPVQQACLKMFRMPSVQTMLSRKSSITNAFVCSIIPVVPPTEQEVGQALRILGMEPPNLRCAYCGDAYTEWDHLRPLVIKRRPTGYVSEIGNLVPSCGKCNQSKGNKEWRLWIESKAALSPGARNVPRLDEKIRRLEAYQKWRPVVRFEFESVVNKELWHRYWEDLEKVISALRDSQKLASEVKAAIIQARHATRGSNAGAAPK